MNNLHGCGRFRFGNSLPLWPAVPHRAAKRWLILGLWFAAACGGNPAAGPMGGTPDQTYPQVDPTAQMTASTPAPSPTVTQTHTPSQTSTPEVINPLTGLAVPDISVLQRWPLSIKVSSYPRTARPQAGLSYADLLIEFYQEAGMTRWHAIYLSRDVEKVGPIRSGRKIDVPFMRAYQSLLVFCAEYSATWEYMELEEVRGLLLYVGPVDCPALCRDPNELPINGIYGNTVELRKAAKVLKIPDAVPDLTGMQFREEPTAMSGSASTLRVRFVSDNAIAEWRYNPQEKKYFRWSETDKMNGEVVPQADRLTGEQLSVSNLIVLYVNYIRRQQREIYELELFGGGKALFFRDGKWESGFWRLPKIDRPLQFFGQDGPFNLRPGVTWIGIVEDTSTEIQEGDTVKVEFGKTGIGQ